MSKLERSLDEWQPLVLSVLRIMAGLLLLQYGLAKILSFPVPFSRPVAAFSLVWFAGLIELVAGALLVAGLFTRYAAFICSGLMAFAYFIGHGAGGLMPLHNGGTLAVLFCFVLLYLFFAGGGAWSLDAARSKQG